MPWIETVPLAEARGLLARIYAAAVRRAGKVFHVLSLQSLNPPVLEAGVKLYAALMHGPSSLSRVEREAIATAVSSANGCRY